ncbi:hypothetical protein Tsubulata_041403 [Turnera subulata]|uniref:Uncharacterized protein n=1 Tax=Turnera subulata TaxID=218843 RepID=A0A9Q0J072_9ROSI|nr:hypothetical protein Tsubulata_041403 [Turnera subulata]
MRSSLTGWIAEAGHGEFGSGLLFHQWLEPVVYSFDLYRLPSFSGMSLRLRVIVSAWCFCNPYVMVVSPPLVYIQ